MALQVFLSVLMVGAVLGGNLEDDRAVEDSSYQKPSFSSMLSSSASGWLQRRDVPEALIDPYSVLGVLSFGVYIFYILYHRYQMGMSSLKHHMNTNSPHSSPPGPSPGTGGTYLNGGSEEMAYLLEVIASKILSNAAKVGGGTFNNTSPLTLDYYDDNSDLQQTD